jgi:orotidine-5'-phosphate decarboxylase
VLPKLADIPQMVAEFVRRAVELPKGTVPVHASPRTPANSIGR